MVPFTLKTHLQLLPFFFNVSVVFKLIMVARSRDVSQSVLRTSMAEEVKIHKELDE